MRAVLKIVLATVAVLALACVASAQQQTDNAYVEQTATGQRNWQTGFITATGYGAPPANAVNLAQANAMARRAATVVARRNLLETLQGVQIDSATTVQDAMVQSDVVVNRVRGFLQNSQILETHYLSDGSVEVVVGINMRGGLADAVIPQTMPFSPEPITPVTPVAPQTTPTVQTPIQTPTTPAVVPATETWTGLLVDASGLGARPAMSPKILDPSGKEVYGSALVSREYAIQQGMAGYAKDVSKAETNTRVASHPLVVKAVRVDGKAKTNLVLDQASADAVRKAATDEKFLEKCRVMIVLD